jgi:uncharacterized protein
MAQNVGRRDFLKGASTSIGLAAYVAQSPAASTDSARARIEPFEYDGVRLLDSRWMRQIKENRDYYLGLANDDILKGFRQDAGLSAPGTTLGGWCERNTSPIFGQWLSGLARLSKATGDSQVRDKANYLLAEWGKTVKPNGDCGMRHYAWEKLCCGLVDMHLYGENHQAMPLLEKVTDYAMKNFAHENVPANRLPHTNFSGSPGEWYTLAENLYRAYQVSGNPKFKAFAEVWLYPAYWNKFADTSTPQEAYGYHAYSHVNTFSSAAMHYEVTGDPTHLRILRNAYDYLQQTQCYATGGYGPDERLLKPGGSLGRALESRQSTFEAVCGSWAGFKLSRYLMRFTGEARYGDWAERLLYNGVGAALPLTGRGRNFYYADYRVGGGMKVYRYDNFTCCSGSLIQCLADYHNLIYYKDPQSLYVNLYVPSEVTWNHQGNSLMIRQETEYPLSETSVLTIQSARSMEFPLRFRVPEWATDMSVKVNGTAANVKFVPASWATILRSWEDGDRVELRIPLRFRWQPVDSQHPHRAAVVRGPVVMAMDYSFLEPLFLPPRGDEELNKALTPDNGEVVRDSPPPGPGVFEVRAADGGKLRRRIRPYYTFDENFPYLMYMDASAFPTGMW